MALLFSGWPGIEELVWGIECQLLEATPFIIGKKCQIMISLVLEGVHKNIFSTS
jgi:hypothetical protein